MTEQRTYPHGVPCWVDTEQSDPRGASEFYGELLGWTFVEAMPPGAPGSYLIAGLDGQDAAAIAPGSGPAVWSTYIAVEDADATAAAVTSAGGTVTSPPRDAGPGGRAATCQDPGGATFRLWQPRRRLGAQIANVPGAWNFSNLHTAEPERALKFYASVFGWTADLPTDGNAGMISVPGYGDHLAATSDPDIHRRQAQAPPGFADVVAGLARASAAEPDHWEVAFDVADRDASAATAERLGAVVLSRSASAWTAVAQIRDPQGATFTLSQFTPPA